MLQTTLLIRPVSFVLFLSRLACTHITILQSISEKCFLVCILLVVFTILQAMYTTVLWGGPELVVHGKCCLYIILMRCRIGQLGELLVQVVPIFWQPSRSIQRSIENTCAV